MGYFKEFKEMFRFYRTKKENKEIVFYAEDAASFCYFEKLINSLINDYDLPICYMTSDPKDPIFKTEQKKIKPFYLKKLLGIFTLHLNSKILIMTMPDLHQFHVKRSINKVNHIYLFHNLGSSFHVIRYGALFYYDTIFCAGPHHNAEIRKQEKLYNLKRKELLNFGYGKVEKIWEEYNKVKNEIQKDSNKKKVLIAPSWGDKTILNLCGEELIKTLLNYGYNITVRPHPVTREKTPQVLENLNNKFKNNENFRIDENISMIHAIIESDILISDWSGVIYEYVFGTERPALFIDVPLKVNNPKYKDVGEPIEIEIRKRLGEILSFSEIKNIQLVVEKLIINQERYKQEIIKARDELIYNFGYSSKIGAEYIQKELKRINT